MFKFLKRFFGSAEEVEEVEENEDGVFVQEVSDGEDALMKNAMLALQTGKVVYGDVEGGVLTSRVSKEEND